MLDNNIPWILNQWNSTHLMNIRPPNRRNKHHCARYPSERYFLILSTICFKFGITIVIVASLIQCTQICVQIYYKKMTYTSVYAIILQKSYLFTYFSLNCTGFGSEIPVILAKNRLTLRLYKIRVTGRIFSHGRRSNKLSTRLTIHLFPHLEIIRRCAK